MCIGNFSGEIWPCISKPFNFCYDKSMRAFWTCSEKSM
jgi:hypothetical protein